MADNIIYTEDYIVEQGVSGIWTYRIWKSGIAECWCTYTRTGITPDDFVEWGTLYRLRDGIVSENQGRIDYPFTFDGAPFETVRVGSKKYGVWAYTQSDGNPTETKSGWYLIARAVTVTANFDCTLDIHAIGKIKQEEN